MKNFNHISVMLEEAVEALNVQPNAWYIDATVGGGGHTRRILEQGGKVVAFDFDQTSIDYVTDSLQTELLHGDMLLVRENFDKLSEVINDLKATNKIDTDVRGVLFDFGTNTNQLMSDTRGLSFENLEAQLDMRLDDRLGVKASDLLKLLSIKQLTALFKELGGEEEAKKIAKAIVEVREKDPAQLETVGTLVTLIEKVKTHKRGHLNPATKVFQALRITVNDELDNIWRALPQALDAVVPGGRIVTIAFHEGEDRLVKHAFTEWEKEGLGKRVVQKPQFPSEKEVQMNPRSRSARMRVFERKQS